MGFKKQEIKNTVEKKLGLNPRKGKENNAWYSVDGKNRFRITYPNGKGELKKGTLSKIRDQFHLTNDEFSDLINCPMSSTQYESLIRKKIKNKQI